MLKIYTAIPPDIVIKNFCVKLELCKLSKKFIGKHFQDPHKIKVN